MVRMGVTYMELQAGDLAIELVGALDIGHFEIMVSTLGSEHSFKLVVKLSLQDLIFVDFLVGSRIVQQSLEIQIGIHVKSRFDGFGDF